MSVITGLYAWGDNIRDVLYTWEQIGIFSYVVPFLLVFAIVFGILSSTRMFGENKGVNAVISMSVGLLALQFDLVPSFFSLIFPYAAIGLSVLLVALILMGLFVTGNEKSWFIAFFIIGALIALIVVLSALSSYQWWGGWWWERYKTLIITLLFIGGGIALVLAASKKKDSGGGSRGFKLIPWRE